MPRKPNPKPDDEEQSKKFLETAVLVEADKTGKNFHKALEVITPRRNPPRRNPSS